jgi:hypothetical protein
LRDGLDAYAASLFSISLLKHGGQSMGLPEVTGRKPTQVNAADHADAYSVEEFCARHRISPQLFYKLKPLGLMPATFNVGARVLISREAAAAWRRARENAAQAAE